ncbi:MAG: hypothetical protein ABI779_00410 [Acidobacteriota bacterium]
MKREVGTEILLKEIDSDGPKYKRFGNVVELQKEVRAALVKLLKERFGRTPSSDENEIAEQTIEATSPFESQPLKRLTWKQLDHSVARRLVAAAEGLDAETIEDAALLQRAHSFVGSSGTMRIPASTTPLPPASSFWPATHRPSFRSAASSRTRTARRKRTERRATTKTSAGPCPG